MQWLINCITISFQKSRANAKLDYILLDKIKKLPIVI